MPNSARIRLSCAALLLAATMACGGGNNDQPKSAEPLPPYKNASLSAGTRATDLLSRMSLEEKLGQMIAVERQGLSSLDDIQASRLGSVYSGGGSVPATNTPGAWASMVDGYQAKALTTPHAVPLIYGIDAVHGHNTAWGSVIFPHNIGLGAANDADLTERIGQAVAEEMKATGIRWTFAPCVTVPRDERWGRTYEGFGEIPSFSSSLGAAYVRGFQGSSLGTGSVLATAKHYLGDGGTAGGVDQGDTQCDEAILRALFLPPYKVAVDAGVGCIMPSYSSWNGAKMHGNHYLITDVLRGELNFKGFVVSDYKAIAQLPGSFDENLAAGINAGVDMLLLSNEYPDYVSGLKRVVGQGAIAQSRIDEAVTRILTVKFQMGLFEHPLSDSTLRSDFATDAHHQLAREAVAKSAVLLKNEDVLPVGTSVSRILVVGFKADNIGVQCGGWTLSWQGWNPDLASWGPPYSTWDGSWLGGTSLRAAIETAGAAKNIAVSYSTDGTLPSGSAQPELVILVIGERPYAEYMGDSTTLALPDEDLQLLSQVKSLGVPIITVMYSGRPLIINDVLNDSTAFIAAWLPGTEAGGLSDVIFGSVKPTGKLSHTWPASLSQVPINQGDGQTPLFALGFGLTYP